MPKTPKGEARQALVTDAALALLEESGARGVTHRSIDKLAGLPEGSTSNIFRTRRALLEATIDRHVERELEFAEAVRDQQARNLSVKGLAAGLSSTVDALAQPEVANLTAARYELYLEVRKAPDLAGRLTKARSSFIALFAELLQQARVANPEKNAGVLAAFMDGLVADRLFHAETAVPPKQRATAIESFIRTLK